MLLNREITDRGINVYQDISYIQLTDRISSGRLSTRTESFHKCLHLHFVQRCLLSLLLLGTNLGKYQAKAQLKQSNLCKVKIVQINKGAGSTAPFFTLAAFHLQLPPTPNSRKISFHSICQYILQTTVNLLYPFTKSLAFLAIAAKIQADNKNTRSLSGTHHSPGPLCPAMGPERHWGYRARKLDTPSQLSPKSFLVSQIKSIQFQPFRFPSLVTPSLVLLENDAQKHRAISILISTSQLHSPGTC